MGVDRSAMVTDRQTDRDEQVRRCSVSWPSCYIVSSVHLHDGSGVRPAENTIRFVTTHCRLLYLYPILANPCITRFPLHHLTKRILSNSDIMLLILPRSASRRWQDNSRIYYIRHRIYVILNMAIKEREGDSD